MLPIIYGTCGEYGASRSWKDSRFMYLLLPLPFPLPPPLALNVVSPFSGRTLKNVKVDLVNCVLTTQFDWSQ